MNYLDQDEVEPARSAYGANYARRRRIKGIYDTENVFHISVDVQPLGEDGRSMS